ncbi:hypothetical protein BJF79_12945 [Actinomadura sp. CNU-125]|nr:hypothetical protein BJF79_12945 [Actinomadura sp. CNU-125]
MAAALEDVLWTCLPLVVPSASRGFSEPVGLVLNVGPIGAEGLTVLAPVVGAEQKVAAAYKDSTDVGLGATAVASVGDGQRLGRGKGSSHGTFLMLGVGT